MTGMTHLLSMKYLEMGKEAGRSNVETSHIMTGWPRNREFVCSFFQTGGKKESA